MQETKVFSIPRKRRFEIGRIGREKRFRQAIQGVTADRALKILEQAGILASPDKMRCLVEVNVQLLQRLIKQLNENRINVKQFMRKIVEDAGFIPLSKNEEHALNSCRRADFADILIRIRKTKRTRMALLKQFIFDRLKANIPAKAEITRDISDIVLNLTNAETKFYRFRQVFTQEELQRQAKFMEKLEEALNEKLRAALA